jgi:hypothetical protein
MWPVIVIGAALFAKGASDAEDAEDAAHAARQTAAAEQRNHFAAQQRMADIKNARERADITRKARIARAAVLNTGANTNTQGSSGVAGGIASTTSQENSNLGMFNAISANQSDIIKSQSNEATAMAALGDAQGKIAEGQAWMNLGASLFSSGGGFKTIFDAKK